MALASSGSERRRGCASEASTASPTTFCVYDGPDPEAIRKAAARNDLPVARITQVRVLDPYFYH